MKVIKRKKLQSYQPIYAEPINTKLYENQILRTLQIEDCYLTKFFCCCYESLVFLGDQTYTDLIKKNTSLLFTISIGITAHHRKYHNKQCVMDITLLRIFLYSFSCSIKDCNPPNRRKIDHFIAICIFIQQAQVHYMTNFIFASLSLFVVSRRCPNWYIFPEATLRKIILNP